MFCVVDKVTDLEWEGKLFAGSINNPGNCLIEVRANSEILVRVAIRESITNKVETAQKLHDSMYKAINDLCGWPTPNED